METEYPVIRVLSGDSRLVLTCWRSAELGNCLLNRVIVIPLPPLPDTMIHLTVAGHHLRYSLKIIPDPVEIPENYNFSQEAWAAVIFDIKGKRYFICGTGCCKCMYTFIIPALSLIVSKIYQYRRGARYKIERAWIWENIAVVKCEDSRSVLGLFNGPFIRESVRKLNLLRQSGGSLIKWIKCKRKLNLTLDR